MRVLHVLTSNGRRGAEVFGVALADALPDRGWPGEVVALSPDGDAPMDVPALGPAPLAFDFAFPILEADGDENQVFAFFVGINR